MKGILFTPEMIQAIVEGRKTQTRRVIKPQPKYLEGNPYSQWFWCKQDISEIEALQKGINHAVWWDGVKNPNVMTAFARYQVGEVVYIKEAWGPAEGLKVLYKASETELSHYEEILIGGWRSPMFMPANNARYFITITDVRAERLQEITEEDAIAEGITKSSWKYDIAPYRSHIHVREEMMR